MYDMSPIEDRGGDEEVQDSPGGVPGGHRLGKERRVPQDACVICHRISST